MAAPVELFSTSILSNHRIRNRHERYVSVLTVKKVPFIYHDLASDEDAKSRWRRVAKDPSIPGLLVHNEWRGTFEEFEEAVEFGELDLFLKIDAARAEREAALFAAKNPQPPPPEPQADPGDASGAGVAAAVAPKHAPVTGLAKARLVSDTHKIAPAPTAPLPMAPRGAGKREIDADALLSTLGLSDLKLSEDELKEILEEGAKEEEERRQPKTSAAAVVAAPPPPPQTEARDAAEPEFTPAGRKKYPDALGKGTVTSVSKPVERTYIPSADAGTKPLRLAKMSKGASSSRSVTGPATGVSSGSSSPPPPLPRGASAAHAHYNTAQLSSKALAAEAAAAASGRALSGAALRQATSSGELLPQAMDRARVASTAASESIVGREDPDELLRSLGLADLKLTDDEVEAFLADGAIPEGLAQGGERLGRALSPAERARDEVAAKEVARRAKEKGYGTPTSDASRSPEQAKRAQLAARAPEEAAAAASSSNNNNDDAAAAAGDAEVRSPASVESTPLGKESIAAFPQPPGKESDAASDPSRLAGLERPESKTSSKGGKFSESSDKAGLQTTDAEPELRPQEVASSVATTAESGAPASGTDAEGESDDAAKGAPSVDSVVTAARAAQATPKAKARDLPSSDGSTTEVGSANSRPSLSMVGSNLAGAAPAVALDDVVEEGRAKANEDPISVKEPLEPQALEALERGAAAARVTPQPKNQQVPEQSEGGGAGATSSIASQERGEGAAGSSSHGSVSEADEAVPTASPSAQARCMEALPSSASMASTAISTNSHASSASAGAASPTKRPAAPSTKARTAAAAATAPRSPESSRRAGFHYERREASSASIASSSSSTSSSAAAKARGASLSPVNTRLASAANGLGSHSSGGGGGGGGGGSSSATSGTSAGSGWPGSAGGASSTSPPTSGKKSRFSSMARVLSPSSSSSSSSAAAGASPSSASGGGGGGGGGGVLGLHLGKKARSTSARKSPAGGGGGFDDATTTTTLGEAAGSVGRSGKTISMILREADAAMMAEALGGGGGGGGSDAAEALGEAGRGAQGDGGGDSAGRARGGASASPTSSRTGHAQVRADDVGLAKLAGAASSSGREGGGGSVGREARGGGGRGEGGEEPDENGERNDEEEEEEEPDDGLGELPEEEISLEVQYRRNR